MPHRWNGIEKERNSLDRIMHAARTHTHNGVNRVTKCTKEFVERLIHIKWRRRRRHSRQRLRIDSATHISFIVHSFKLFRCAENFWLPNYSIWRRKLVGREHNCVFALNGDRSANRVLKIIIVKANENTPPQRQRRQPTTRRQAANTFSRNKNESRSRMNMMNDPSDYDLFTLIVIIAAHAFPNFSCVACRRSDSILPLFITIY